MNQFSLGAVGFEHALDPAFHLVARDLIIDGDHIDRQAGVGQLDPRGPPCRHEPRSDGCRRGAVAAEPDTTLVAVGAKASEAYTPSAWEWTFVAGGHIKLGQTEEGLEAMREGIAKHPDAWQGPYNLACFLARLERNDEAIDALERAVELGGDEVREYAEKDSDFGSIRDDPRFKEKLGA